MILGGVWLAQSIERGTLDLKVLSVSPTLRTEITFEKFC